MTLPLAKQFAARIAQSWRRGFDSVIETGKILNEAKAKLEHGKFLAMIESELPFKRNVAERLMTIVNDARITKRALAPIMPPHWSTLYELTKLDNAEFDRAVKDKIIHPDMTRGPLTQAKKKERREQRERDLGTKQTALPQKKYGVILADPEWRFEPWSRETGMDRAADNHYPTSCTAVIAARDVQSIAAKDCVLFLWATIPMLPHALVVMEAWGFDYKSHFAWTKDKIGMGYWSREIHELLLIGTRGNIPAPAPGTQFKSALEAPRGKHSAKPELFLTVIEKYFPTLPKIELNRRGTPRAGWDAWGFEVEPAS